MAEVRPPPPVELDGDPAGLPREPHRVPPREVGPHARVHPRVAVVERRRLDASRAALVGRLLDPVDDRCRCRSAAGRRPCRRRRPSSSGSGRPSGRTSGSPCAPSRRRRRPSCRRTGRPCRCWIRSAPCFETTCDGAQRESLQQVGHAVVERPGVRLQAVPELLVEDPVGEVGRRRRLRGEEERREHGEHDVPPRRFGAFGACPSSSTGSGSINCLGAGFSQGS